MKNKKTKHPYQWEFVKGIRTQEPTQELKSSLQLKLKQSGQENKAVLDYNPKDEINLYGSILI